MKISRKLLLNNILVGFVPLIIAFTFIIIVLKKQAENYVHSTLSNSMEQFKERLEAEMNKFRDYSYFISREANDLLRKSKGGNLSSYKNQVTANRYKLRMFELFKKDEVYYRDMYSWKDNIYLISQNVATEVWTKLNDPLYTRHFKMSYPDVISNVLIIRNCSIIYNELSDQKTGFSAISTPIDGEFLREFGYQDTDEVIVVLSADGGVTFSHPEFETHDISSHILEARKNKRDKYQVLDLTGQGRYYFYQENLYKLSKIVNRKMIQKNIADVAILYNYETVNRQIQTLTKIVVILFVIVLGLVMVVSIYFARSIIPPIMNLKRNVEYFQQHMVPVPPPEFIQDEISMLQNSFSQMSETVLEKSEDLTEALTQLALANEQLSNMSILDGLTGVKNRRYFNKKIEREVKRASRLNKILSLLMLDIDHFKAINDTYGHQAGDKCLQFLAETLNKHIHRAGDDVSRYGGEEFSIILPNTDQEGAYILAERIRKEIMKKKVTVEKKKIQMTLSIGVASINPEDNISDQETLVQMADDALYEAKENGRNRVVIGSLEKTQIHLKKSVKKSPKKKAE